MKNMQILLVLFLFNGIAYAQSDFTVSGKVIDSSSMEPLAYASVFCQNTTQGTATNKEGQFSLTLRPGGYDLIITYTGYQSRLIRISPNDVTTGLEIIMVKEEKSIEEVVIQSSNLVKDGWEKYGHFFIENFIGSTPLSALCFIQNPEVLKFYYYKRSDKLKVLADSVLLIQNYSLGYTIRYHLDSLMFYYQSELCSYRGFSFYEEMKGTEISQSLWNKNRQKAYLGSRLHFMHSYYNKNLDEQGFRIGLLDESDNLKFNRILNPYDPVFFTSIDSLEEVDVNFPRKINVTYLRSLPENEYLVKFKLPMSISVQDSYIDLRDMITIKKNGYFYDQKDWVNYGYWSWKNVADQVPYDYTPQEQSKE